MSRINFDDSERERPDLISAWSVLRQWVAKHPQTRFIEARRVGREFPDADFFALDEALSFWEDKGVGSPKLRLKSPEGVLLDGEYASLGDVPELVWDRFGTHKIATENCEVISGFLLRDSDG